MDMQEGEFSILKDKLEEFIRKYYKNQVLKGALYVTSVGIIGYLCLVCLEYYGHFSVLVRSLLFYGFIAAGLAICIWYIIIPCLKVYRLGKVLSYEDAAAIIGAHFSSVKDKLLNVLQLQSQFQQGNLAKEGLRDGVSVELLHAAIQQKIVELKPVPFVNAVDFSENKKYLRFALPPLVLLISLFFISPSLLKDGTQRLVNHNTFYEKPNPYHLSIENKSLVGKQEEDFELQVRADGELVPKELHVQFEGNDYHMKKIGADRFVYTFNNLRNNINFQLATEAFQSKPYTLTVLTKPVLIDFSVQLAYPAYLHKKPETMRNTGDIATPEGTMVTWHFNTKNTTAIQLKLGDSLIAIAPNTEGQFIHAHRAMATLDYSILTLNASMANKDAMGFNLNVIPDAFPVIEVVETIDSASPAKKYFSGHIADDYGISQLTFHYNKTSVNVPINLNANDQQFVYSIDFAGIGLKLDESVIYWFEVRDNDGVHGPKMSRSAEKSYHIPSQQELAKSNEAENGKLKQELKSMVKEAKELQKQMDDLNRKLIEEKSLTLDEKKKMEQLLDKQSALQQKVAELKAENEQHDANQQSFQEEDSNIAEKQKALEDLLEQVLTPEMTAKMEEMRKLLKEMDKDKVQDELAKMKQNAKDVEKELDRALEAFKRLEVEEKLQANIEGLEQLKKEQAELKEKIGEKQGDNKALEQKEKEIEQKFDDFKKDMDQLEQKNKALDQPNQLQNDKRLQDEISKDMKAGEENLKENKKSKAAEKAKKAAEEMESLSQQLKNQQKQMEDANQTEDAHLLRKILSDLLELSFRQEALMQELKQTSTTNPKYIKIAQVQKGLAEHSKVIEDSLLVLSKRQPNIQSTVNREINAIHTAMGKSIAAMAERQTGEAASDQQFAMTSINNLALMLNESLQDMQQAQQMKSKSGGEGSCKKPGGKGKKPGMANLRKMQQELNEQLEKMKNEMGKGGTEGKKGMDGLGGGKGEGSKQLAKLAAQQEYIRREMQKAAKGSAGDAANKMEKTETDLVNKVITPETTKRQQEILNKLLEFEKAEKEQGEDDKRQATESKKKFVRTPETFKVLEGKKERETELLKTVPPSLSPFYKSKVNDYFNTFE